MKPYLKTKAFLVSLALCGAVQLIVTAEANQASVRKGKNLTANTTTLLAQNRLNRLSESETRDLLNRLDNNARDFQRSVDRALDDSRSNDSKREDNVNKSIKEFRDATKRLRDRYSREQTFSSDELQDVLNRGAKIDNFFLRAGERNNNRNSNNGNYNNRNSNNDDYSNGNSNNSNFNNGNLRQEWEDIRADLDILARSSYGRGSSYNRR